MSFGKAPIKGEGQIVSEYKELSDKEKLREAQEYIKRLKKTVDSLEDDAMRYRRMRQLEIVIMAEDGAKYLKGKELDDYIDTLPARGPISRAEFMKDSLAELTKVFDEEYTRYKKEVINDKA
jgi:hypothetical protein